MKLEHKIGFFLTVLLTVVIGGIGILNFSQVKDSLEVQMGNNAMDMAVTIASLDEIGKNLSTESNHDAIQDMVENIRVKTRFQYIIVLDMKGIKYSYPYDSGLGKPYRSGGEEEVLNSGTSYISADRNKLISAIRAFTPIYYNGEQVGAVVVGLLIDTVNQEVKVHYSNFWLTLLTGLSLGIIGSLYLSNDIKNSIFGLDPKEIAMLLSQREIVLHSLKNGIVTVDNKGKLQFFNKVAEDVLELDESSHGNYLYMINSDYSEKLKKVFDSRTPVFNEELKLKNGRILLCSHNLLTGKNDEALGVVSSFQDMTEVKTMAEELTGIRNLMNAQRAQSHEFMNRLHTISGLIQLEEYDDAIDYISKITTKQKNIVNTLTKNIENVYVAGHLLAKYNKTSEKKIDFNLKPNSKLKELPPLLSEDEFCSLIGNLVENSIDELCGSDNGKISIYIGYEEDELIIEVDDNGRGVDESVIDSIFDRGFSTKDGSRGYGLSIVKGIVDKCHGMISVENDEGAKWTISIPMEVNNDN